MAVTEHPPGETAGERVQFETLLSDLSAKLVLAGGNRLEGSIVQALDSVRSFFDADRCGLIEVDPTMDSGHVAFDANREGIPPVPRNANLATMFPWTWTRVVGERNVSILSRLADLPPEAATDHASYESLPTKSSLVIPVSAHSDRLYVIVIGHADQEIDWPREFVPRLRLLGETLVGAIEREEAHVRALEQAARIAAAVDAAELGFAEWSPGAPMSFVDERARELLGFDDGGDELVRDVWLSRIDAEMRPSIGNAIEQLVAGDVERIALEYRYHHPSRGAIWLKHAARRVVTGPEDPLRIVDAFEDATERRSALEDVKRLRDRLERENRYLRHEGRRRLGHDRIIGRSEAIRSTLALADRVASTNSTVLLLGETGCGKEWFASYIHEKSQRSGRTMIRVSCASIPTPLMESELFGREKGAYTGALSKQIGRFELANGSTLFLDEIGELPLEVQVKLLRVLESRSIERLGSPRPIPVDVRIIAATHRDLAKDVREGRFREDLYYRLKVFPISVPPLRERRDDIPLLIDAFIDELAGTVGQRVKDIDPACTEALLSYRWPGNVRELRNVVEHAMIMATGETLRIEPPRLDESASSTAGDLKDVERSNMLRILNETAWRIRGAHGAAARLGLKPTTLESRIKKLGLTRPGLE